MFNDFWDKALCLILDSGKYPSNWKKSFIILIHKAGEKLDINNRCFFDVGCFCISQVWIVSLVVDFWLPLRFFFSIFFLEFLSEDNDSHFAIVS
jgi:hypothetical protein